MSAPAPEEREELEVLSFGEALLDFFPSEPGTPLEECTIFHRHLGGAPCNVAVGLARLGRRTGLMTLVGPDAFGRSVRQALEAEGIDVRGIGVHRTAKTGVTFVSVARDGARSFLFFRHPSADQMVTEADVDERLVASARVLHVGSSTLAREPARAATWKAIAAARQAGRLVSADPNWRPHLWDDPREAADQLARLVAAADVLKVSDDELQPLVGTDDPVEGARRLRAAGCTLAVVTLGGRGAWFDSPAGSGQLHGEQVAVVDTTGAGDAFTAALLAHLLAAGVRDRASLAAQPLETITAAVAAANRYGAQAVTALGATAGLPRRA